MKRASRKPSPHLSTGPIASTTATREAGLRELELRLTQLESENRRLRDDCERVEIASANYAKLYDLAPVGLVTLDLRGRILSINHTGAALLGRDQARLLEQRFALLVPPDDVPKFSAHLRTCQGSHKIASQELHLRGAGGQPIPVQLATVAVRDGKFQVTQFEMTFVDLTERKLAEAAQQTTENNLRTLIETSPHPVQLKDASTRWLLANRAALELFDLTTVDYHHKRNTDLAADAPFYRAVLKERERKDRAVLASGQTSRGDECVPKPDGTERLLDVIRVPLLQADDTPKGLAVLCYDITERKQSEEAIRAKEAQLRTISDITPVMLTQCSRDLRFKFVNPAYANFLGLSPEQIVGKPIAKILGQDAFETIRPHVERVLQGESVEYESEVPFRGVGRRFIRVAYRPEVDEGGEVVGWVAAITDITERKQAEEALRESEDRFRLLASHAPVGIFMSDPDGNAIYVNETWCVIAGLTPEQARGKGWLKAVHPGDRRRIEAGWEGAVTHGDSSTTEFRFLRPVAKITWVLGNAVVLRNASGVPTGYVGTIADITVRKQAEETLRESRDELEARVRGRTLLLTKANQQLEAEITERKLVEASLRESEERFRLLVSGVHDYAIYMLDAEGRVASWNAGAERIKGYRAKEIMGRHFSRFFPREDVRSGQPQRLLRIAAKLGHVADDGWRVRKDGSRFWAQAVITALRDELGRLRGFSKVTRDITEHRRVQEALRESEARLRAILDNSPAIIFLKDRRGRYLHFNREFEKVFNTPLAENVGKTDAEIFPPEQATLFQANDQKVLRSGVAQVFDEVARHDDGSHSSIVVKYPLRAADGEIYAVGGIVTDITERRRAEEALRLNEKNLADFFEQAPLGLLWVSPQGDIVRVNKAQLELLGCTAKHCLGRRLSRFFSDPELINEALAQLARHEKLQNYRARLRRKDGSVRHVLIDANGLWRKDKFLYSRWFVRDITHRVELEKEILAISEREQQRLGHDLHDDLCQQLSGIEFLSETLAGQLAGNARLEAGRAKEIAGLVRQAIHHTRELARGLSPVRLVEDGLMLALRELADRTERLFHITCNFQCRTPVLINDEAVGIHLYRIAQEAVSNAIKHGKARRIDIGLTRQNGDIVLAVSDNGVGFPVKLRKRKGMGLRVMQYRSSVLGGSLVVQRRVNGGTSVVCTVKNSSRESRFRQKGKAK